MADLSRIKALELAIGLPFPKSYRQFLEEHKWVSHWPEWIVRANPDRWGVHGLFELDGGASYAQSDEAYRLVFDVIPNAFCPIGEDASGNLYLIDCRTEAGPIFWWDHERSAFSDGLESVSETFIKFLEDIAPE
ncbi:SMI1/KNR4 family protein [Sphingobium yanoikuyae]|uniref:SMI1/KNR4 family protein n=1 Tax=Sphingobium yanoikuyae TaxID=13690 RepID=UPI0035B23518